MGRVKITILAVGVINLFTQAPRTLQVCNGLGFTWAVSGLRGFRLNGFTVKPVEGLQSSAPKGDDCSGTYDLMTILRPKRHKNLKQSGIAMAQRLHAGSRRKTGQPLQFLYWVYIGVI